MTTSIEFIFLDGQRQEFSTEKKSVIVGRGTSCDIVLPFDGVSRQHAQFEFIEGEVFITDLGSTNGILIDGKKIQPKKKTSYQTFLNLQFGPFQSIVIDLKRELTSSIKLSSLDAISKKGQDEITNKQLEVDVPSAIKPKVNPRIRSKKEQIEAAPQTGMVLLFVIALIGGGVYFQFFRAKPTDENIQANSVQAKKVVQPITSDFKTKSELLAMIGNFNCNDKLAATCAELRLKSQDGEGVLADGPNLLALVNMKTSQEESASKEFADLLSTDRYEVYLLDKLHKTSAISYISRNPTFTNLQLIGFLEKGSPILNLKLNKDLDRSFLDPQVIGSLIDEARSAGLLSNLEAIRTEYKIKEY